METDEDIESMHGLFHDRARELFSSLFRDFNATIEGVSRHRDEYLFRQQREQYVNQLKQQLQIIAQDILRRNQQDGNLKLFDRNMDHFIADYVHEFVQKVKFL